MEHNGRDESIRRKILSEVADIESFLSGMTEDTFRQNRMAQKAVVMSLINIGELSKAFSQAFLDETKEIPWKDIRGLRNIAAHQYDRIEFSDIWVTAREDLPVLKKVLMDHVIRS